MPNHPSSISQGFGLFLKAEVNVDTGEIISKARRSKAFRERSVPVVVVFAWRDQEPGSGDGREGDTHQELRVILDTGPCGGIGPAPVEDKLSFAMHFEIDGASGHEPPVLPDDQGPSVPPGLRVERPGSFEGREPFPFKKGRSSVDQGIPFFFFQGIDALGEKKFRHSGEVYRGRVDQVAGWGVGYIYQS